MMRFYRSRLLATASRFATGWAAVFGLALLLCLPTGHAVAQEFTVSGTVTDGQTGQALPGANIRVVGTQIGAVTNVDGQYELQAPSPTDSLRFTFVGYGTRTVPIQERSTINVTLEPVTLTGGEVVVTGYSAQQKQDFTGSVEVVNTADMQELPEAQITDQLQGMASGVNVISSGQPGQTPQIRIRGINTFGNNTPLFVVDGVSTQSIDNLDPNDVESIQVLKDASAASIYGSRASNGVVIIETKQGSGDVSVQFNSYAGTARQPDTTPWDIAGPQARADLEWLAFRNSGVEPSDPQYGSGEEPVLPDYILPAGASEGDPGTDPESYFVIPDYTDASQLQSFNQIVRANKDGTNWFDAIMQPAAMTKSDLTVSGGGEQGSFLLSAGYTNQEGNLRRTFLERYNLRANTSFNVNEHITIGENLAYSVSENKLADELVEGGAIGMAMRMRPIVPVRDVGGNFAGSAGSGLGNPANPVAMRYRTRNNESQGKRLFGNTYMEVSFLEDFRFKTLFGGSVTSGFSTNFTFPTYENAENTTTNSYGESAWNNYDWTWTNTLNYQHTFGQNHEVSFVGGAEWIKNVFRFESASVQEFFSFDPDFVNLTNGAGTKTISSSHTLTSLASQFGKLDYNYAGKYFVSGTLRRDGSSKFLRNRYGLFPAASVAWRISEESFMPDIGWLTDLKFRGGWGVMGNQLNVGPNNAFSLFSSTNSIVAYDITGSNAIGQTGFFRSRLGAPGAKWERDENINVGVDLAVLDGQLEITADYYRKDIEDLLFNPELPGTAGQATAPFINVASMKNSGVDASVRGEFSIGDLDIDGGLNFTSYNNEITKVAEGFNSFSQESRRFIGQNIIRNEVGQPMSSYYGFDVVGFWGSEQEIQQANQQAQQATGDTSAVYQLAAAPGRFRYKDVNGDGVINSDDRTFLGSPHPDFTYGINLSFQYDSWDMNLSLFGSQGAEIWNQVKWWTDFFGSFNGAKSVEALRDSWKPGEDNSNASLPIQELGRTFSTNAVPNSYFVENASYLRIKNLGIGYTLPTRWMNRLGAERLRVYVKATNLLTLSGYSNPEPEIGGDDPTDVSSFGIDEGAYPRPRQFIGGVNLTF